MKLSPHFTLAEFTASSTAKQKGLSNAPNAEHLSNLKQVAAYMEWVRHVLGNRAVTITSGYRSPAVNKAVGGVPTSDHAEGWAVDFRCSHIGEKAAAEAIIAAGVPFDQLIWEVSRRILHISFDPKMRRQVLTQKLGAGTPFVQGLKA